MDTDQHELFLYVESLVNETFIIKSQMTINEIIELKQKILNEYKASGEIIVYRPKSTRILQ